MHSIRTFRSWRRAAAAFGAGLALLAATGCIGAGKRSVAEVEAQYKDLQRRTESQTAELKDLRAKERRLEELLGAAERRLAKLDADARMAALPTAAPAAGAGADPSQLPRRLRTPPQKLSEWAARRPGVSYDDGLKMGRFQDAVLFERGQAVLTREGEEAIGRIAKAVIAVEADDLNLMIVGHTDGPSELNGAAGPGAFQNDWQLSSARAVAVADALRKAGVAGRRLGVSAFGDHQPIVSRAAPDERRKNQRVEIFLIDADTPLVGRLDSTTGLY